MTRPAGAVAGLLLVALATPLLANGGTVRLSRQPVGPYLVSVMSSPTPLRTGEVDISVLVQDSAEDVVPGVPVVVEAVPVRLEPGAEGGPVRHPATRQQATNKFFLAAKFDVEAPGEWEFRVHVGEGGAAGAVAFQATVSRSGILDHPYLLAGLILLPLVLVGWLLGRRDADAA